MSRSFRMEPSLYIATRNNEWREDISHLILNGEVSANEDARIQMSFTAQLRELGRLRPHQDFIAPYLRVIHDDGRVEEGQVGLYTVLQPEEVEHRKSHTEETIDGRDLTWFIDADTFTDGYTVPAGIDYVDAAIAIIQSTGHSRIAIPRSGVLVPEPIDWQPGDSKLDMVNELMNEISYYRVWADNTGRIVSIPYLNLETAEPTRRHRSGFGCEVVGDISESQLHTSFANVIVVISDGQGDQEDDIESIVINDNASSPTSTVSLGVTIRRTERTNVATQAAADALAARLLQESMSFYRKATIRTFPDPNRGLHEVFEMDMRRRGNPAPLLRGLWWVRAWKLGFTPSTPYAEFEINQVSHY